MNDFEIRENLIAVYNSFAKGFITLKDEAINKIESNELSPAYLYTSCYSKGNLIPVEQWDKNNWPKKIHKCERSAE